MIVSSLLDSLLTSARSHVTRSAFVAFTLEPTFSPGETRMYTPSDEQQIRAGGIASTGHSDQVNSVSEFTPLRTIGCQSWRCSSALG